jgi:pilus assembly protein Flp/PilA
MASVLDMARLFGVWVTARLNIKSERGATAVEYGVMVALIAAVIIAAVVFLGNQTSSTFSCTADSIANTSASC